MKINLRMLGLGLCLLPISLHAWPEQSLKSACPPAQPIPVGTILPVSLNSTLRSDKSARGATIAATVMQDVHLGKGQTLRAGSKVTGHVVEVVGAGKGSDKSKISFQFDRVQFQNRAVSISTDLRALVSVMEVDAARSWSSAELGNEQVSYGDVPVMLGSKAVGDSASQGALAHLSSDLGPECGSVVSSNSHAQALWLFSTDACGIYGLGDLQIIHSGRTEPVGEVTLTSNAKAVKVSRGSAMLLRVDGNSAEEAVSPDSFGIVGQPQAVRTYCGYD
jgi:hypothetical protein